MTLKTDALSEGFHGIIYDNSTSHRMPLWQCLCVPAHKTKAEAKQCASKKLKKLKRKEKS